MERNNNKFKIELTSFTNENILIGVDVNFYMDPKFKKMESITNGNPIYIKEICAFLESMNLTDCFRNIYPNLRRYTLYARGKSLDYWFISENLLCELETGTILTKNKNNEVMYDCECKLIQ